MLEFCSGCNTGHTRNAAMRITLGKGRPVFPLLLRRHQKSDSLIFFSFFLSRIKRQTRPYFARRSMSPLLPLRRIYVYSTSLDFAYAPLSLCIILSASSASRKIPQFSCQAALLAPAPLLLSRPAVPRAIEPRAKRNCEDHGAAQAAPRGYVRPAPTFASARPRAPCPRRDRLALSARRRDNVEDSPPVPLTGFLGCTCGACSLRCLHL